MEQETAEDGAQPLAWLSPAQQLLDENRQRGPGTCFFITCSQAEAVMLCTGRALCRGKPARNLEGLNNSFCLKTQ